MVVRGTGVIEPLGQDFEANPVFCALHEPERLP